MPAAVGHAPGVFERMNSCAVARIRAGARSRCLTYQVVRVPSGSVCFRSTATRGKGRFDDPEIDFVARKSPREARGNSILRSAHLDQERINLGLQGLTVLT